MAESIDHEGHKVRARTRYKACGRDCSGCPHATVVVEVQMPSGRVRELWAEPPTSSGRRRGPPRTRAVAVGERKNVRGPSSSRHRTRG